MPFAFGEMPEELRQMIDRQHLEAQVTRNEVDRFMDELPLDDLVTLRVIIRHVATDPSNYGFFDGIIYTRLRKEGRCTTCGGPDHDHEALESLNSDEGNTGEIYKDVPGLTAAAEKLKDLPTVDAIMAESGLSVEDYTHMTEYDLDDLRDSETGELLGFVCTRCGMVYPSIADRMLRRPDECSGCFRKAGHG
jgi:hypothetical protein